MKTKTSLQILLFISLLMTFITFIKGFVNTVLERPNWLVALQLSPIPIFMFAAVVISLDLVKKDYVTLKGRLKSKVRNKIVVKVNSDVDRKFTVKNDLMNDISEDNDIEIQYYKRTKAVISIKSINSEAREF
ncbi:hypothetical protein [Paenibacillus segetis]|uniref:Uncharacterized protein n=1 Tax=Paenibacillus segetis TaxID=1325360 RepID=A0ABQ1YBN4_9BACL|nr:hypothetical protein [Paenibacillus segetis]GGH20088.1 hypothetical protein GCM10008013_17240 [Paenibacillus segetis]